VSITGRLVGQPREIWRELFRPPQDRPAPRGFREDLDDLRKLAWEGLYWEGEVEDMLCAVREDAPLTDVAPASGKLVSRYCEMRQQLRRIHSPELELHVRALSEIFDYLAQLLHHAVALLATSWRSERLRDQQRRVGRVGPQAERLHRVVAELDRLAALGRQ